MSGEYQFFDIRPSDLQFSLAYHVDNALFELIEKNPNMEAKLTFNEANRATFTFANTNYTLTVNPFDPSDSIHYFVFDKSEEGFQGAGKIQSNLRSYKDYSPQSIEAPNKKMTILPQSSVAPSVPKEKPKPAHQNFLTLNHDSVTTKSGPDFSAQHTVMKHFFSKPKKDATNERNDSQKSSGPSQDFDEVLPEDEEVEEQANAKKRKFEEDEREFDYFKRQKTEHEEKEEPKSSEDDSELQDLINSFEDESESEHNESEKPIPQKQPRRRVDLNQSIERINSIKILLHKETEQNHSQSEEEDRFSPLLPQISPSKKIPLKITDVEKGLNQMEQKIPKLRIPTPPSKSNTTTNPIFNEKIAKKPVPLKSIKVQDGKENGASHIQNGLKRTTSKDSKITRDNNPQPTEKKISVKDLPKTRKEYLSFDFRYSQSSFAKDASMELEGDSQFLSCKTDFESLYKSVDEIYASLKKNETYFIGLGQEWKSYKEREAREVIQRTAHDVHRERFEKLQELRVTYDKMFKDMDVLRTKLVNFSQQWLEKNPTSS